MRVAVWLGCVAWLALGVGCGGEDDVPRPRDGGPGRDAMGMDASGGTDGGGGGSDAGPETDGGGSGADGGADEDGGPATDGGTDGGPVSMPCTAAGDCDPFDATSCPDGQSCRPATSGASECMDIDASPAGEDEPCTTGQGCAPGLLCLDFGGGFTCQRMCPEGSIGFCGDGKACFGSIGHTCIRICRPIPEPCDIFAQDCADPDDTCTFTRHPETDAPYTGCRPAGTLGHGDECGAAGSCGHGLVCIRAGSTTTCHHVCGPDGADPQCTVDGEECTGFARTWMVPFCQ